MLKWRTRISRWAAVGLVFVLLLTGCGIGGHSDNGDLSGKIRIDGSSTVFPVSQAVAEEFMIENPRMNITVGMSGTGGGFKKFASGEIEISDASRAIREEEAAMATQNGVEYIELQVAMDGLVVAVSPENDFVDYLTVDELKKIWEPNSTVRYWSDVRPEWPQEEIKLYGPGPDSGTFDYFTEAVVGEGGASRADYNASEDDNVLVIGVSGDKYSLGYFGYAYYEVNKDKIRPVPVDGGLGPVEPTVENINQGTYAPLSRPVYIYVNKEAYDTRREVKAFVQYYMDIVNDIALEVGFIPMRDDVLAEQKAKL